MLLKGGVYTVNKIVLAFLLLHFVLQGQICLLLQVKAGQKLTEFCQENALVIATLSSNNTREDSTYRHHQMVSTEIRLIIFFAAKYGEALYSQQK